eukprot:gnl/MRDRNA2_/MRDRNA2_129125_c0_seq1.p1 gnl/MRDRNA2_/MRDRNA2_129125_c0~~gnl/MRDRNA2_/MRDRNA2_129125_c0_seq1.p1  ORF type:complete len:336 (-),score=62.82 gnl/MRDRNA2_/MRDRNA2_129125_c0_seq1:29-1036(-)
MPSIGITLLAFVTRIGGQKSNGVIQSQNLPMTTDELVDQVVNTLVDTFFGGNVRAVQLPRVTPSALVPQKISGFNRLLPRSPHGIMNRGSLISKSDLFQGDWKPEWQMEQKQQGGSLGRRQALATGISLGLALGVPNNERPASAVSTYEGDLATFCGTAFPPGNKFGLLYPEQACGQAVYKFEYPDTWDDDGYIGEIDRTIKNVDGRVFNPKVANKNEQAFTVVQSRTGALGEGIEAYDLKDTKATLNGFSGGFPDFKETLDSNPEISTTVRSSAGFTYYDHKIIGGNSLSYLASITEKDGRLFGLFIKATTGRFKKDEKTLEKIQASFRLTGKK